MGRSCLSVQHSTAGLSCPGRNSRMAGTGLQPQAHGFQVRGGAGVPGAAAGPEAGPGVSLQDSRGWGAAASSQCWHWVAPARTWHRAGCPGHIPLGTAPEQPGVWGRQWRTFPGESAVPVESDPGACQVPALPCTAEQYLPQSFPSVTRLCHLSVTELVKANPIL